jgi:hypothetical protein
MAGNETNNIWNMKNIKRLAVVAVLGLAVGGLAIAQVHRNGGFRHGAAHHYGDPAALAKHLGEVFPQIATYDANKDRTLDGAEKEALGKAIADGKLQLPAHTPPNGVKPTAEKMLNHICEMFAYVSGYDANRDGGLDATEQAAIKSAIEKGEFTPHGQHPHNGGDHH